MAAPEQEFEQRMMRLTAATANIVPRVGYEEQLLVLLGAATANDVSSVVVRFGKIGVAIGALVAAAAIVLAQSHLMDVDQEEALAYGTTEYFE